MRLTFRWPVVGVGLLLCCQFAVRAQRPAGPAPTFKVGVDTIRVDAVVTDRDGNLVTDLTAADFELRQDGEVQTITLAQYIAIARTRSAHGGSSAGSPRASEGPPSPRSTAEGPARTIVLVVDDLGIAAENIEQTRRALRRFVNEDVHEGDLVAMVRTAAPAAGAFQALTTDRALLYSEIGKIQWTAQSRRGVGSFEPLNHWMTFAAPGSSLGKSDPLELGEIDALRESMSSAATLGAIVYATDGIRDLPGRKAVVLVSEGFLPYQRNGAEDRVVRQMNRLTDLALRTGTVIYTLNPRGIVSGGISAEDNLKVGGPQLASVESASRRQAVHATDEAMAALAERTGGLAKLTSNDVARALRQIGDDIRGYYILGYDPPDGTFAQPGKTARFHKISLKVRRPELRVRTREGFIGAAPAI